MLRSSRSHAPAVALVLSAGLIAGCGAEEAIAPELPEGVEEDDELVPSNEPTAENPHDAEGVDIASDVALRAVNIALNQEEGTAVAFLKDAGDETGMSVDVAVSEDEVLTVLTNQEGTEHLDTTSGDAEDDLGELGAEAEVPLLRAMEIAQTESAGLILNARLEDREGDLIVWNITVEGPTSENSVIIDARNSAIVPEGDNPLEDNGIGGDPEGEDATGDE